MPASSRVGDRQDSDRKFSRRAVAPQPASPPSPRAPKYEDCVKYTANTYSAVAAGPTTMVTNGGHRAGAAVGDTPTRPSNGESITRTAAGGGSDNNDTGRPVAPKVTVRREEVEMRYDAYVWVDFIRKYWLLFIVGNLLSAAVVIFAISQVDGCFDDVTERQVNEMAEIERDTEASLRFMVIAILVFGLVTEFVGATVLCFVYESPLDIKSLRKIPPKHVPTSAASVVVNLVAPFSWGVIFTCGSFVSLQVETFSSCGGHDGPVLDMYLIVSGWGMLLIGLAMLGLAGFLAIFMFSCGSSPRPDRSAEECCTADKIMYGHRILSKAALLDVFWQLQGSVWLFRTGGVGGFVFVVLVAVSIVGAILAALGSRAPASVAQELPGSPLVLGQPPDVADGA